MFIVISIIGMFSAVSLLCMIIIISGTNTSRHGWMKVRKICKFFEQKNMFKK